jgi:uncharacterized protein YegP (UPF0339 family)
MIKIHRSKDKQFYVSYHGKNNQVLVCTETVKTKQSAFKNIRAMAGLFRLIVKQFYWYKIAPARKEKRLRYLMIFSNYIADDRNSQFANREDDRNDKISQGVYVVDAEKFLEICEERTKDGVPCVLSEMCKVRLELYKIAINEKGG